MEVAGWFLIWVCGASFCTSSVTKAAKATTTSSSLSSSSSNSSNKNTNNIKMSTNNDSEAVKKSVFGVERCVEIPSKTFPKEIFPSNEEIKGMEDLLPGCQHGWFPSCYPGDNSVQLHYRKWIPESNKPKAVVVWMHGIATHCGVAFEVNGRKLNIALLSQEFIKNNIALYAFDMYGHGFSEGKRMLIPDTWKNNKQDYINFCNTIVIKDIPDVPVILSGESYGGCLTIHVAKHFQETPSEPASSRFDSFFVNAPAVIGDLPPYPITFSLRYLLAPYFPEWIPFFMPNPISADRIWRDPDVLKLRDGNSRYASMGIDGSGRPFHLGTAVNLIEALEEVRNKAIPGLNVPFLVQHGTNDYGVPIEGAEMLYDKSDTPTDKKVFHKLDGAYHDLLADENAEKVVANMIEWVNQRVEAATASKE